MISDTADGIALGMGEACGQREKNWSTLLREIAFAAGLSRPGRCTTLCSTSKRASKRRGTGLDGT